MKVFEKIYNGFLNFFGDIKVFKFPMFMVYDPGSYLVKGEDAREVINLIKPGDILVRGYVNYLDGYFIPGFFSHAGLYLGEVKETDRVYVKPGQDDRFRTGEQMVIHSMAEGVFMEDIINFCRCDYMVILRRNPALESDKGKQLTFDTIFKTALGNLGKGYDFKFDFSDFTKVSCTELVYVCCRDIMDDYGIEVKARKALLFINKRMIAPDDFVKSKLGIAWKSKSVTDQRIQKIKSSK